MNGPRFNLSIHSTEKSFMKLSYTLNGSGAIFAPGSKLVKGGLPPNQALMIGE